MDKIYLVEYNDIYGTGQGKVLEVALTSEKDFKIWLDEHNARRVSEGEMEEGADEFNLIELSVYQK